MIIMYESNALSDRLTVSSVAMFILRKEGRYE